MSMVLPTKAQRQLLQWIERYAQRHHIMPSVREMARRFQKSPAAIHSLLQRLEARGYVTLSGGLARGLQVKKSVLSQ